MPKPKKPQFSTPFKYIKSKKDMLYNKSKPVPKPLTEQQIVRLEGRY